MSEDRTERPTGRRLAKASEKGQIARSRDLGLAATSIAVVLAFGRLGGRLIDGLGTRLTRDLAHFGDQPIHTVTAGELTGVTLTYGSTIALLVGPIALTVMTAGIVTGGVQAGWTMSAERLQLHWAALNPANGFKRFAPGRASIETLKTLLIGGVIAWLCWRTVRGLLDDSGRLPWMSSAAAAALVWDRAVSLLWQVAWAILAIGVADYGLQKYRLLESLKMTKQEVKDEARMQDGSPEVKGRIRRVQREMARRRMLSDVKKATVVITNPTHFAVALEYRRGSMAAPLVLAKGQDHLALAIRERARQHGVPVVENRSLARALFAAAEVGQTIPAQLYAAVAEVLAQLIRLRQLTL